MMSTSSVVIVPVSPIDKLVVLGSGVGLIDDDAQHRR
jgi:hypothetical protein